MRKFLCLLLSILLTVSLAVPAFAADEDPGSSQPPSGGESKPSEPTPTTCPHSQTTGAVTQAATCTVPGTKTYTCTSCGAVTGTESIPATGVHTWDGGTVTTAATCSAAGVKTYSCACGATQTEAIAVDPSAHTYGAWSLSDSSHSRTCSGCGKTESGSHSWGVSATVPATCKDVGAVAYGCTTCGGIAYEVIPVLTTHTYDTACDPDCNVCGATREVAHKFSAAWSRNSTNHWHACTLCGEKKDIGGHFPGPAATEEKAQLCLTCGLTMTPQLNHTHKYETAWTSDETGHWYACSGCEDQKDLAGHDYDNPCDPDCNTCGYTTANAHAYSEDWNSNESGHWGVCTICGENSDVIPHIPGPEATETAAQLCETCGFELAPALEHVHEFTDWLTDAENHWKECECGEKSEEAAHSWDEGTEHDGTITYLCTECQAERVEDAPETADFPFEVLILVILLLVLAGAVTALVLVLRKPKTSGKFHK